MTEDPALPPGFVANNEGVARIIIDYGDEEIQAFMNRPNGRGDGLYTGFGDGNGQGRGRFTMLKPKKQTSVEGKHNG